MELRPNHQFDPFSPDAAQYDGVGLPDLDGIDFNDPASFMKMLNPGMPIPELAKPEDVLREAKTRSNNIFVAHDRLRGILDRHEATIQKRWTKKTRTQRQAILLKGWPEMPPMHRPDFEAFKRQSDKNRTPGKDHRGHFIWPYINQEDLLARPKTMLLLLNARARRSPCDFAGVDNDMMHLGRMTQALVPIFLNEYVMVLNGVKTPSEYGKLVAWEDHPDAFDWMTSRKQFLPGEGLLILEAQERLLEFLLSCCKQILHEIPEEDLTSDAFPLQPEPRLKTEVETNGFDSLAIMAAEAPYRVPAQLDFARIESLLSARTSAAEDHMWALPKTRGTAQPQSQITDAGHPDAPTAEDTQPTFVVDARALKVFRTLFYDPSVTSTPGEIPWNDFLHALTSTGFAAEKLYGSVWQLSPTMLDVERSIQFHEPHPRGKIPFHVARRHGRRLSRAYGWHGAMFVLKE